MKLDKAEQSALLRLSETDLAVTRIKHSIAKVLDSKELQALREQLSGLSGELITARTLVENLTTSQVRADEDLHLVESRIARDRERLNQTSSPKDAQGMQSEIESLLRRKADLEDNELNILEDLDRAKEAMDAVHSRREDTVAKIENIQSTIQAEVDDLKTSGRKLTAEREILVSKIPADVLEHYAVLSAKQIAVGKIEDRTCSACRMGLTASTIDALNSLAEDEIGSCPECQAMIVR